MLIPVDLHVATGQILKEQINGCRTIILGSLFGVAATFDDVQELIKLNHFRTIVIDGLNDFLHLLTIVYQAQSYKRILKFVHTDTARAIIVKGIEIISQLN